MLTKTSERTVSDGVTDNVAFAGRVKRYHTWPTIQNQTVGEHCWQVALVYQQIWGDIPFPTKSKNPDLKTAIEAVEFKALEAMDLYVPVLHPDVKRRIKICDLFEMMLFGMVERQLGNLLAEPIILRTRQAALKLVNEIEAEGERNRVYAWAEQQEDRHAAVLAQLYKEN
jgi:5'-deoxynucleotidase YfbR-like HD superfamily hydrolase